MSCLRAMKNSWLRFLLSPRSRFAEAIETELKVDVEHADGLKCERCWNWSSSVGADDRFPTIDSRCVRQIEEGWEGVVS